MGIGKFNYTKGADTSKRGGIGAVRSHKARIFVNFLVLSYQEGLIIFAAEN